MNPHSPMVWLTVTLFCLVFCTLAPIWIKNDRLRQLVSWYILVPLSLLLIAYDYPAGIKVFSNWALK